MIRTHLLCAAAALALTPFAAAAQEEEASQESFGGARGADLSIEAIEPDGGPVTIGRAGEYPADISRYLLANGPSGVDLSPDGQWISFIWDVTGDREIWVMPASGGQARQLTFETGVGSARWTPDSSRVFFKADRVGNEQPGYFALTPDGMDELEVLPAARGDFRIFGDFAEDGSFIYASTARGTGVFDIYRGTMEGESELIIESELGLIPESVSPDGRYALVTETVGEDADNLFLLDLETREMTTISKPAVEQRATHTIGGFAWHSSSQRVLFSTNINREFAVVTGYSVVTGEDVNLADANSDMADVVICGSGDTSTIAYTENRDGFDTLVVIADPDPDNSPAFEYLPEGKYSLDCEGDENPRLIVTVNGWRTPGEIWSIDPLTGEGEQIFAANLAGLDPDRLIRPQVVRYTARDGVELQGLLYLPPDAGTGEDAPPVLFSVHGGPSGQSQANFDPIAQYHVARGVAVFEPNVRGSTGLGRTYSTLDDRENRLDSVRDLVDLKDALAADGLIDGDRAAVMGGSYGGYMVNAVLAEYPGEFVAGVSLYGVADWVTALEIASPALKAADRIEYGDITEQRWREYYQVNSPIRKADQITVPVLFSHGMMDPRIDIYETEVMVQTLRANGIEAPFVRIPDEGHGWRKLSNQLFYYRVQAEFVEAQLGLAPQE